MFEVTLLFLAMLLIAAFAFLPMGYRMLFSPQQSVAGCTSCPESDLNALEDSPPKHHFLAHLHHEIESTLFPRPTDSILQRHYDGLIRAEVDKRLAGMPDS